MVRSVANRQFGVSTRLYRHQRLSREHLAAIAAHGFETVEVVADGVCRDFAHAQRGGELVDTIETVSEHLITTHVPVDSAIDWLSALTAVQKVGYEGPFVFDIVGRVAAKETLQRARKVRERMERMLVTE